MSADARAAVRVFLAANATVFIVRLYFAVTGRISAIVWILIRQVAFYSCHDLLLGKPLITKHDSTLSFALRLRLLAQACNCLYAKTLWSYVRRLTLNNFLDTGAIAILALKRSVNRHIADKSRLLPSKSARFETILICIAEACVFAVNSTEPVIIAGIFCSR